MVKEFLVTSLVSLPVKAGGLSKITLGFTSLASFEGKGSSKGVLLGVALPAIIGGCVFSYSFMGLIFFGLHAKATVLRYGYA